MTAVMIPSAKGGSVCWKLALTAATCLVVLIMVAPSSARAGQSATTVGLAISSTAHGTTPSLLQQAIRATAAHRPDEAQAAYEKLCRLDPVAGLPLYARFLARTGQTSAARQLATTPRFPVSPVVRARAALAADDLQLAAELLDTSPTALRTYPEIALAYNILSQLGESKKARELLMMALRRATLAPAERLDLFKRLVQAGGQDEALVEIFLDSIRRVAESPDLEFTVIRETVNESLDALDGKPGYDRFRQKIVERATSDPLAAWVAALALHRKGEPETARALLRQALAAPASTSSPRAILLAEAAQEEPSLDRAEALYRELLASTPRKDRVRLKLAGVLFKAKRFAETLAILDQIDRTHLDEGERKLLANMRLTAMAKVRPAEEVVRAFEREALGHDYRFLRELAEAPFALLPETRDHLEYRKALQARLRETTAPPELLVLMMSTEHQLRSEDAVVAALQAYTDLRPKDYDALEDYAIAASQRAYSRLVGPHETTPSLETIRRDVDAGARALWNAIKSRPYAIQPYLRLIELYRVAGQPDKARRVVDVLCTQTSATAEDIHLAAYLLDESGDTTTALPLYHQAIQRDPQNGRFKMNLANAYRKLGRGDDAMKLYRELFEHGSYGRQHHIHQLTEDAFALAEQMGRTSELVRFWRGLADRSDVPQRDELLVHVGELLSNKKRFAESLEFLERALQLFPETRDEVEPLIAKAAAMQGDLGRARSIYEQRLARCGDDESRIQTRTELGQLYAAVGEFAQATATWLDLAATYPDHPKAARALILAAQAELARHEQHRARQLLEQYLSRDRGDSEAEQQARELLDAIGQSSSSGAVPAPTPAHP